ncbi:MAG: hypothetical protein GX591_13415 [Planctomycetes bacterium]|nr:hypothetical protein [Planctomycetota bacterium]
MFEQPLTYVDLPDRVRQVLDDELQQGERVQWAAQPIARRFILKGLPLMAGRVPMVGIPAGILAGLFAVVTATTGIAPLVSIPIVAVALEAIALIVLVRSTARGTVYILTDRRALLVHLWWIGGATIRSFRPADLGACTRRLNRDGSGDLVFAREPCSQNSGQGTYDVGFLATPRVEEANAILRRMTEAAGTAAIQ